MLGLQSGAVKNVNLVQASFVVNRDQRVELTKGAAGAGGSYVVEIGLATDDLMKMRTYLTDRPRGGAHRLRDLRVAKPAPPHRVTQMDAVFRNTLTPARAGLTGLVLVVVRIEVLTMCALAGSAIGGSDIGMAANWILAIIFVAVAASTVAIPVLAYAGAGDRLAEPMTRLKNWMERNNAALLAAILIVIGLMVLHNGVKAL